MSTTPARAVTPANPLSSCAAVLASGFGFGYSPVAPGTAGSLLGLLLLWPQVGIGPFSRLIVIVAVLGLGIPAASLMARQTGRKDPGVVVIDEVVGMWISVAFLPWTPLTLGMGFVLFRALDVIKPYPARDLESLRGGWGIMADDVAAGLYANLLLRLGLVVMGPA